MGHSSVPHEDDLPVLHLRKWAPSEFPYNPSYFREGFISPARRLLLLLSYDAEGLLLPLGKGQGISPNGSETTCRGTFSDSNGISSASRKNISGSSEAVETDVGYDSGSSDSESRHAFFSDVDSVAWGLTGAAGTSQDDAFQDLLFISGKHGVVVHAFSQFSDFREAESSVRESDVGQGTWVEWGPLKAFPSPTVRVGESESSGGEWSSSLIAEQMKGRQPENSKVWMRTFLAEAERLTLDDVVYTKFPKKTLFPKNVVVSFRIFNFHSQFPDFLFRATPASFDTEKPVVDSTDTSYTDTLGTACEDGLTNTYSCVNIFSDSSSQLVGFALSKVSPMHTNCSLVNNQSCKFFVVVARIIGWGLKWVYSVMLGESMDNSQSDWIDFTFSYSFLICLSKSGFISLYGSITGAYVGRVDILNACSLGYCPVQRPVNNRGVLDEASQQSCHQNNGFTSKRRFKRLHTLPYSSFLGVMDEYGVIYVFPLDGHVLDEQFFIENSLSSPCRLELGVLTRWHIGSVDIGFPRVLSINSISQGESGSRMQSRDPCLQGIVSDSKYMKTDEIWISQYGSYIIDSTGETNITSQKVMVSGKLSQPMRKIFLPLSGFSEDDIVCFSPFGITRLIKRDDYEKKLYKVVHADFQLDFIVQDESSYGMQGRETSSSEAIACNFDGLLYLVTREGISVVLPSVSVSPKSFPIEDLGYDPANRSSNGNCFAGDLIGVTPNKKISSQWRIDVLDRVIIYEGLEVAERLSVENEWDLGIARIRHLQLALHYLEFDLIQNSLEMLMGVNLALEAILRLLFAAVYLMIYKVSNDNEVSCASRLLALASSYATMVIRKYGLLQLNCAAVNSWDVSSNQNDSHPSELMAKEQDEGGSSKGLWDLSKFLIVIRRLQRLLNVKHRKLDLMHMDHVGLPNLDGADLRLSGSEDLIVAENSLSFDTSAKHITFATGEGFGSAENLALVPTQTSGAKTSYFHNSDHAVVLAEREKIGVMDRNVKLENPRDMIARWDLNNMDLNNVVKDALLSGRLPLAVLRLHIHHLNDSSPGIETRDTFRDVRIAGRAISYDLFLKGEIGLAVTTLQKLGEDVENALKELVFGTFRRSLRKKIAEEMKRYVNLGPHETKILNTVALIERIYPCNSFFSTLAKRQKELDRASNEDVHREMGLHLLHPQSKNLNILCGEMDGVVLGSWKTVNKHYTDSEVDDDSTHAAYWAAAAAWADAWDQRVVDRILLDQPLLMGVHLQWESQLEYHMCHNDWLEVSKLLDVVPSYALSYGSLSISLDGIDPDYSVKYVQEISDTSYLEELGLYINVPGIRVFRFSANRMSSLWLRMLIEQSLAKKFIFLANYWHGTAEITALLAQSGFLVGVPNRPSKDGVGGDSSDSLQVISDIKPGPDSIQALHKLVIRYASQNNLLHFLDIYLDIHQLALDQDSLSFLLDAAGDNEWVKYLLLLRVKGKEYEASFANASAIASHNSFHESEFAVAKSDVVIESVDDIAEVSGAMAALATLMFAPIPLQECISSRIVNRHCSSAHCTLENLRPALQRFPTMRKTLFSEFYPQNSGGINLALKAKGYSELLEYMNWREGVFSSSTRDTSILHMIPCWFPKAVRRLIQLYVQGPICWRIADLETDELSILRDIYYVINSSGHTQISALSWEATVQKHVEEELYASSLKEAEVGLEHHLHRGRPLCAFNHLLLARVQNLKSKNQRGGQLAPFSTGQSTVHLDVQALMESVSESESSLLLSVMPLAIQHFGDPVLVSSCVFLLDLCGLDSMTLQTDVAVLKRISSFYKSAEKNEYRKLYLGSTLLSSSPDEFDVTEYLARTLAEHYLHNDLGSKLPKDGGTEVSSQPSQALQLVLQHLEKASLPAASSGVTCGSWLMNGNGDGTQLRSQQKATSDHWQLVTTFCQVHGISPSIKYLAVLATDNDWVGFLSEAQVGKYPFETVIQVASREFGDPHLRIHILTVLKNMRSRKIDGLSNLVPADSSTNGGNFLDGNFSTPVELFSIIAECEKLENPGEALLLKAKNLCWSFLAVIASCFHDVSLLSCLTVWLEITAARETSAIKVNDIASQIAKNVGAAVEATNLLPASSRTVAFHYNRKNSKRRRLVESIPVDLSTSQPSEGDAVPGIQGVIYEEQKNKPSVGGAKFSFDSNSMLSSLSSMVAVLCEQHVFLPLLQAFEIFLPSCLLLPFIRGLQAFSQMRLSDAMAYLGSFSIRIKEESPFALSNSEMEGKVGVSWTTSTAVKAADVMLSTCPSPYEKKCLLKLLAATDFGDSGTVAMKYQQQSWKLDIADHDLRGDECPLLGQETLDDASLLTALEKNGYWEQARSWAKHLEACGDSCWNSATDHVTEMQAEAMISEWKEFLQDVPEERVAMWRHCHTLFIRYSYPALKAGQFFLKHADLAEKDTPARELHEMLLLALQWLSGIITQSNMCCSLHLLREIEMRVWLLAVEVESHVKREVEGSFTWPNRASGAGNDSNIIDHTASITMKIDKYVSTLRKKYLEKMENSQTHSRISQTIDHGFSSAAGWGNRTKRRAKGIGLSRKPLCDAMEKKYDSESVTINLRDDSHIQDESLKVESSSWRWEERVEPAELEITVLSLLDFGQITAARQLQAKLSPENTSSEFLLVDAALKLAALSTPGHKVSRSNLDNDVQIVIQSLGLLTDNDLIDPLQVLESLSTILLEGKGRGLCKRIISVMKTANLLEIPFMEAFEKQPVELLQLLSLKAQDSFEEACLLVQTHSMPAASIAQILAESFLKGLLAAHRGGYIDFQKEEGPAPLLWRFSDFLKWAELCPSQSEIGHALMKLVITGQEIPHACEVELLILSHHFYKLSGCLDGVDVLVALAATRVEAYVSDYDFSCLARLITGVGNFHALNFILGILIENGQLDLLLQKYSAAADANSSTADAVRSFRMAVITSVKQFTPDDLDSLALVYNHFDMKHDTASLLESRAKQSSLQWFLRTDKNRYIDLLESMRYFTEAAEVYSSIDAGYRTRWSCAQALLISQQIKMPDTIWLDLSATNARRVLVEQPRFQEALIVAEAYGLNQPTEWALVLWERMLNPELTELFLSDFVAVLPLHPSMLLELSRFYKLEIQARGSQSHFSVWLSGGGLPADWVKYVGKSFKCLLRRTRDFRLKLQMAITATGFDDVVAGCNRVLDKVPENAGPLILRKGHGGAYLPLM